MMGQISVNVIKKDKSWEAFQMQKIVNSCIRAGISKELAQEIAESVSKKVYPNIPVREIRKMVQKKLERVNKEAARKYKHYENLRP